jgi:ribonuclease HI
MSETPGKNTQVYVDAKILGMHDVRSSRKAFVGYYVKETGRQNAKPVVADESDDAEIQGILFAIEELKDNFDRLEIICDHQSVVSEATRESAKKPSPLLQELRRTLQENPRVILGALQTNLAHKVLTDYVNGLKQDSVQG